MLDVPVLDVDVRYLEPKYNLCKGISLFTVKQVLDVPVLDVDVRYLEPKYNLCKGISLFTVKQVLDVPVLDVDVRYLEPMHVHLSSVLYGRIRTGNTSLIIYVPYEHAPLRVQLLGNYLPFYRDHVIDMTSTKTTTEMLSVSFPG